MSLINLKEEIKTLAARKAELTRQRVEYKAENRPKLHVEGGLSISQYEADLHGIDYTRADAKFEVRCALLAYGFLRGRKYKQLERKVREGNEPQAGLIAHYIVRYGGVACQNDVLSWLDGKAPAPREMPHPAMERDFSLHSYHEHVQTERDGVTVTLHRVTREVLSPIPATIGRVEVAS
jgi:hypothetical protein